MTDHKKMGSQEAAQKNTVDADRTAKPEIDPAVWASLGGSVKPSRTERRPKRGWRKQGGVVSPEAVVSLLVMAGALVMILVEVAR